MLRFAISMHTQEETDALAEMLRIWTAALCLSAAIVPCSSNPPESDFLFWDLDCGTPPDSSAQLQALFVCSSSPQAAINSYTLHPAGFLTKPVQQNELYANLRRCAKLWWAALERLELSTERVHIRLPLCDLVWIESTRRGTLLHSSQEVFISGDTLSNLETRLPKGPFFRCHRSFLVNLIHIQQLEGNGFRLFDGTEIPIGRVHRTAVTEAYRSFYQQIGGMKTPLLPLEKEMGII